MLGVSGAVLRASGALGAQQQLVSLYLLNSGLATDSIGDVDGTVVGAWTATDTDSLVQGVTGTSFYKSGGTARVTLPAGSVAHDLDALTLSFYFQPSAATAKHILFAAGNGSQAGDFSIERLANGRLRGWHVGQDTTLRYFEGFSGITGTNLQIGTAYRIDVSFGPAGARIYLDGTELVAARITANTNGWNNSRVKFVGIWTDGALDGAQGIFDHIRLWSRQLNDGEIAALQSAQSITLPGGEVNLLGAWPMSEPSGIAFADTVGGNTATLAVPSWTIATHAHNRRGIVAGSDHALEVSNGGPAIPMAAGYKQAGMSLALYVAPLSELRGTQYWDDSDARHGREFIAHCDDGSTPGSFAIERRRFSATEWRLDGYVRNGAGTVVRFSGGLSGIAGATLPIDVAKRIVLTQGPGGATLYLDDAQVANLPTVTQGWGSLTTAITLGSSSDTGHANHRSPLWGRLDQIEVWQGEMELVDVQALAAAAQSLLWRYPADFVGGATDINIANYAGNVQAAMDAAHAASRYVYQAEGDTTYYSNATVADNLIAFKPNCKGLINVRLKMPATQGKFRRLINISEDSGGQMGAHDDPYVSTGGYKFIGCKFDGNSRGQNWHPKSGQPGYSNHGFDLEQQHAIYNNNLSAARQTVTLDACEFYDGCGDALSLGVKTTNYITSARFYGYFRGAIVVNESPAKVEAYRYESFSRSVLGTVDNGCGLQDIEAFAGAGSLSELRFVDAWAESDFDDENEGQLTNDSYSLYYNVHMLGASIYIGPSGTNNNTPTQKWEAWYCTFSYHSNGGNGTGNYPSSWWKGFPAGSAGLGCLFDHCIFIANGTPYYYHESWLVTPNNTKRFYIDYQPAGTQSRLWTMRTCEFRVLNLPGGLAQSKVQTIDHGAMSTSRSVELDGVLIDSAFANAPFEMGGVTVRYRNVLHERTGNNKPWSNAGAEVPL